jgi:hypothetical protein
MNIIILALILALCTFSARSTILDFDCAGFKIKYVVDDDFFIYPTTDVLKPIVLKNTPTKYGQKIYVGSGLTKSPHIDEKGLDKIYLNLFIPKDKQLYARLSIATIDTEQDNLMTAGNEYCQDLRTVLNW